MTYRAAQDEYYARYGKTVESCWIAHIKRDYNATTRVAHNRAAEEALHPCPPNVYKELEAVMLDLGVIKPTTL